MGYREGNYYYVDSKKTIIWHYQKKIIVQSKMYNKSDLYV